MNNKNDTQTTNNINTMRMFEKQNYTSVHQYQCCAEISLSARCNPRSSYHHRVGLTPAPETVNE